MDQASVTRLLQRMNAGESEAREQLVGEVYEELHTMAVRYLARERVDHTLQPTALVSELYLKLFRDGAELKMKDREHLLTTAARAMRRLLIDHARQKKSLKRGGEAQREELDHIVNYYEDRGVEVLELDEALDRLGQMDPQLAQVVELRFFGGRTNGQVAEVLGTSERSVERAWATAKAWLKQRLQSEDSASEPLS